MARATSSLTTALGHVRARCASSSLSGHAKTPSLIYFTSTVYIIYEWEDGAVAFNWEFLFTAK